MLGRLKMDVKVCIDAYVSLFEEIFSKKVRYKVPVGVQIQSHNISESDKGEIKRVTDLSGSKKSPQAPFDAAFSKILLDDGLIVEQDAACATSAATSFFDVVDTVDTGGILYRVGGFGANNPVNEVWMEARQIWIQDDYNARLDPLLKCFISIGTGELKTENLKKSVKCFIDTLANMLTQTRRSGKDFQSEHPNLTKLDGT
ncbi:uncharacterized protein RAG0_08019 [Rhynchosporium agropyri]|uniref:PNPLA domain-containing protein n=1 Tax=Rhynchosporium agropyri TaxID=914238 RepID=A0A1E1KNX1_9HELO|nr:uncharacterized protein RAG0_08019 [Rhynchosporium agropyri]